MSKEVTELNELKNKLLYLRECLRKIRKQRHDSLSQNKLQEANNCNDKLADILSRIRCQITKSEKAL